MRWKSAPLGVVSPAKRAERDFAPDEVVWHLNLDQIESQTGRVLAKQRAPASSAGSSTFAFDEGNVLYSKLRPYLNKVVRPDEPGIGTTELVPLRPVPDLLEPDFLKFYLRSDRFVGFANSVVAGAKMPRMIMDKFWEHHIPLPAPKEQRRVVELLEQADGLRGKRKEATALGNRILPALFRKMFGDPGMNPKAWPKEPLGNLTKVQCGFAFKSDDFVDAGVLLVRISNLVDGLVRCTDGSAFLPFEFFQKFPAFQLSPGDLLIALSGATTGKLARFDEENIKAGLLNQRVGRFLVRNAPRSVLDYLEVLLETPYARVLINMEMQGGGQPNLAPRELESLAIPRPPDGLLNEFGTCATRLRRSGRNCEDSRQALENLFKTMLHRAFSGELTAEWRQSHLRELLAEMEHQVQVLNSPIEEMSFG
jgi:type I restriction enzyme, S subunit